MLGAEARRERPKVRAARGTFGVGPIPGASAAADEAVFGTQSFCDGQIRVLAPPICGKILKLAEQAVGSGAQFRNHVFKCGLLRLGQGELRRHLGHVGLHQVGLRCG